MGTHILPFRCRSIVTEKNDQCILILTVFLQNIDELANTIIHNFDHGCISRHGLHPGIFLLSTQFIPRTRLVSQNCILGCNTQFLLSFKSSLLELYKSGFVTLQAFLNPFFRCLNRSMRSIMSQVQKEWFLLIILCFDKLNS